MAIEWDSYDPVINGKAADVFIKWMSPDLVPPDQPAGCDDYMVGKVWPDNQTVFPDFLKPETAAWWGNEIELMKQVRVT